MKEDESVKVKPIWTLENAGEFVRAIGGTVFRAGYAPAVFGGVLHRGESLNDLDILLVRRPQILRAVFPLVEQRLLALGMTPFKGGRNNVEVETSVPFRIIYRYKCQSGLLVEFTVINLHPEDMISQTIPFPRVASKRAEEIGAELDLLEGLSSCPKKIEAEMKVLLRKRGMPPGHRVRVERLIDSLSGSRSVGDNMVDLQFILLSILREIK